MFTNQCWGEEAHKHVKLFFGDFYCRLQAWYGTESHSLLDIWAVGNKGKVQGLCENWNYSKCIAIKIRTISQKQSDTHCLKYPESHPTLHRAHPGCILLLRSQSHYKLGKRFCHGPRGQWSWGQLFLRRRDHSQDKVISLKLYTKWNSWLKREFYNFYPYKNNPFFVVATSWFFPIVSLEYTVWLSLQEACQLSSFYFVIYCKNVILTKLMQK